MKTALVVDDNKDFRGLVCRYLGKKNWHVIEAKDYAEALPLTGGCDIIVLDYDIGHPDGEKLLQDIRKDENLVPVVMVSGIKPPKETVERFHELGIFEYVEKPVSMSKLYESIDNATKVIDMLDSAVAMSGQMASTFKHA